MNLAHTIFVKGNRYDIQVTSTCFQGLMNFDENNEILLCGHRCESPIRTQEIDEEGPFIQGIVCFLTTRIPNICLIWRGDALWGFDHPAEKGQDIESSQDIPFYNPSTQFGSDIYRVFKADRNVKAIFVELSQGVQWNNLWRIYEIINLDLLGYKKGSILNRDKEKQLRKQINNGKNLKDKLGIENSESGSFRIYARSSRDLREGPRHLRSSPSQKNVNKSYTLYEGFEFIRRLAAKWLEHKGLKNIFYLSSVSNFIRQTLPAETSQNIEILRLYLKGTAEDRIALKRYFPSLITEVEGETMFYETSIISVESLSDRIPQEEHIVRGILVLISGIPIKDGFNGIQFCVDHYELVNAAGEICLSARTKSNHTNDRSPWLRRIHTNMDGTKLHELSINHPETVGKVMQLLSYGSCWDNFSLIIEILQKDRSDLFKSTSENEKKEWVDKHANNRGRHSYATICEPRLRNRESPSYIDVAFEYIRDIIIAWLKLKFDIEVVKCKLVDEEKWTTPIQDYEEYRLELERTSKKELLEAIRRLTLS